MLDILFIDVTLEQFLSESYIHVVNSCEFLCAAVIAYKTVNGDKTYQKAVHMTLQGIAILLGVVGILAALKFHNDSGIQNFYSLHSWLGIITIVFYLVQVLVLPIHQCCHVSNCNSRSLNGFVVFQPEKKCCCILSVLLFHSCGSSQQFQSKST